MKVRPYQVCRSRDGWQACRIPSTTDEGVIYTVLINPWGAIEECICECRGYTFTGHCKHQQMAFGKLCRWSEGGIAQTEQQKEFMVCPSCGGNTRWEVEPVQDGQAK